MTGLGREHFFPVPCLTVGESSVQLLRSHSTVCPRPGLGAPGRDGAHDARGSTGAAGAVQRARAPRRFLAGVLLAVCCLLLRVRDVQWETRAVLCCVWLIESFSCKSVFLLYWLSLKTTHIPLECSTAKAAF